MLPDQRARYDRFIRHPHGLILVTGPTGSGKSTSLYAALQDIARPDINISTIEDPVEYRMPSVNQVQVNARAGVTFAVGLRALVRQDPDVILVGEIRDAETAEVAIQAALTGHLVLSSLHTRDAPSALVRLTQMGVEPYLVSSSVVGVVGQRLLRSVCPHCRIVRQAKPAELEILFGETAGETTVAEGKGCPRCDGMGTRGRTAAFEIAEVTDAMREIILRRGSGVELMQQARTEGMVSMREAAVRKVLDHAVPVSEIVRVFGHENL
jgi:type IV pilus assembly protein PilB